MGCYDSVMVDCPGCDSVVEIQSKADKCMLYKYDLKTAPVSILGDIADLETTCENCKTTLKIKVKAKAKVKTVVKENT